MVARTQWVCPNCQTTYAVPSTAGLTVCPSCAQQSRTPPPIPVAPSVPRRKGTLLAAILVAGFVGMALVAWGILSWTGVPFNSNRGPDYVMVKKWLKNNLDDPTWEEVAWVPTIELKQLRKRQLDEIRAEFDKYRIPQELLSDSSRQEMLDIESEKLDALNAKPIRKICAIKFRTNGPFGRIVRYDLFEIVDGRLVRLDGSYIEGADEKGWSVLMRERAAIGLPEID